MFLYKNSQKWKINFYLQIFFRRSVNPDSILMFENRWEFQPSKKYKEWYADGIEAIESAQEEEAQRDDNGSAQVRDMQKLHDHDIHLLYLTVHVIL